MGHKMDLSVCLRDGWLKIYTGYTPTFMVETFFLLLIDPYDIRHVGRRNNTIIDLLWERKYNVM